MHHLNSTSGDLLYQISWYESYLGDSFNTYSYSFVSGGYMFISIATGAIMEWIYVWDIPNKSMKF